MLRREFEFPIVVFGSVVKTKSTDDRMTPVRVIECSDRVHSSAQENDYVELRIHKKSRAPAFAKRIARRMEQSKRTNSIVTCRVFCKEVTKSAAFQLVSLICDLEKDRQRTVDGQIVKELCRCDPVPSFDGRFPIACHLRIDPRCRVCSSEQMHANRLESALKNLSDAIRETEAVIEVMRAEHDPLAVHIFLSRRQHRNLPDTKSGSRREIGARLSWQMACELGFRGSLGEWERLMGAVSRR
jgi:hypothetical protein